MHTTISQSVEKGNKTNVNLVQSINQWIAKQESNYYGICALLLGVGTGLASIPVAIATSLQLFVIALICVVLAMAGNVMVISQQPLKTVVWTFLAGITVNTLFLVYLIWISIV